MDEYIKVLTKGAEESEQRFKVFKDMESSLKSIASTNASILAELKKLISILEKKQPE